MIFSVSLLYPLPPSLHYPIRYFCKRDDHPNEYQSTSRKQLIYSNTIYDSLFYEYFFTPVRDFLISESSEFITFDDFLIQYRTWRFFFKRLELSYESHYIYISSLSPLFSSLKSQKFSELFSIGTARMTKYFIFNNIIHLFYLRTI